MAGQISVDEIGLTHIIDKVKDKLKKILESKYIYEHYLVGQEIDVLEVRHHQMWSDILCKDICKLEKNLNICKRRDK